MSKGIRFINGKEYMLGGRVCSKEEALSAAKIARERWELVRIIKLNDWDFTIYVHGSKS